MGARFVNMTGRRFGSVVAVAPNFARVDSSGGYFWRVRCDCGREFERAGSIIRRDGVRCETCSPPARRKPFMIRGPVNRAIDRVGERFARLVVLARDGVDKSRPEKHEPTWRVVCDCGLQATVKWSDLRKGRRRSCGQCTKQGAGHHGSGHFAADRTGQQHGALTVIGRAPGTRYSNSTIAAWRCRCDCSREVTVREPALSRTLKRGVRSCGCRCTPRSKSGARARGLLSPVRARRS